MLHPDEPHPVLEYNTNGRSPFLIASDHHGRLVPRSLGDLGVSEHDWERHIAWDIGVAGVATRLADALNAHLLAQRYSRLVIDCNRPIEVESSIPIVSEATPIPGNEGLSPADRDRRRRAIFDPYHAAIAETLDRRQAAQHPTVLLALHSFTPVYGGIARPWHIGMLYQHDTRLPHLMLEALRKERDLVVGDNEPYAVRDHTDYTIPVHGQRRGLIHTGIELRQDLIAHEAGQTAWAERLAGVLKTIEPLLA